MKILILANSISGLYEFRRELVSSLVALKHEVVICVPAGKQREYFESIGCRVVVTEISRHGINPVVDFYLFYKYVKCLKREKPDIVFTYTIKPNIYGGLACSFLGIPYVANVTGLGTALESDGFVHKVAVVLYRLGLKKAKTVFCQNHSNLSFLKENGIVKENAKLIPGSGVNLEHFRPLEFPSDGYTRFLYIGRVMRAKGIEQFLDAAKYIVPKYENVEFHIVGRCEDDYKSVIKDLAEKQLVVYHGYQDDVRLFHKISSCTIHASFYAEGMSNVLLESCACARPIITTDRPGCGEIVDDGVNGFVVKQRDSQDLIEKIEKFLALTHEQKLKMGEAGRAKVEKEFNRQIVVDAYLKELS